MKLDDVSGMDDLGKICGIAQDGDNKVKNLVLEIKDIDLVKKPLRSNIVREMDSGDDVCHVLSLLMGEGKTHEFGSIAYQQYQRGVRVLAYLYPQNEIFDKLETQDVLDAQDNTNWYHLLTPKLEVNKTYINRIHVDYPNRLIIVPMTHAFQSYHKIIQFLDESYDRSILAGLLEEAHSGAASHSDKVKDVAGYYNDGFKAQAHKWCEIIKYWNWAQINTATPTKEHLGELPETYRMLESGINPLDLACNKGFYDSKLTTPYRISTHDKSEMVKARIEHTKKHLEANQKAADFKDAVLNKYEFAPKINTKIANQICTKSDFGDLAKNRGLVNFGSGEHHTEIYQNYTRRMMPNTESVAVVYGNKYVIDPSYEIDKWTGKDVIGIVDTSADWLSDLKDPTHSLIEIITKQKGKMGISVDHLNFQFYSKEPKTEDESGKFVLYNVLQNLGRLVRLNLAGLTWTEISMMTPCEQIDFLKIFNTYGFTWPEDDPYMRRAVEIFLHHYSISVEEVFRALLKDKSHRKYV